MMDHRGAGVEKPRTVFLHYSAAPVVGGVEAVIHAHAQVFVEAGYPVTVIAGRGEAAAQPAGVGFDLVPLVDDRHPYIADVTRELNQGLIPPDFQTLTQQLVDNLSPLLRSFDALIVHNIFGKHYNLPLTAALGRMLEAGELPRCIAWSHDFSWISPNSLIHMHPGYPWDLLRTPLPGVAYVAVSRLRQKQLAGLFDCPPEQIRVIYNGVEPVSLLGISAEVKALADRLGLLESDLILLMPVRVTRAKNIEQAMQVAAALKRQGISLRLVVTGPPDPHEEGEMIYFRSLLNLRAEVGVEQEVRFVYESGPVASQGLTIEAQVVGDLYRLADLMFMPSHREGFGMPVLEAGLAGLPVLASRSVPAAMEVAREEVMLFDPDAAPEEIAAQVTAWMAGSPTYRLKRKVRQGLTWKALLQSQILPLLTGNG